MAKKFKDYSEVDESMMEGFTVAKVSISINAEGSGMMLELERRVDNVSLGIDLVYDPTDEDGVPFRVSEEYVKRIRQTPEDSEKKVCQWRGALENNN